MIPAVMPTYARFDLAFERGEGTALFTADGTRYLDFTAGIAVCALGHCHPHLVETLVAQGHKLWHTSNLYQVPNQIRLAERLVATSFADTAFFVNSGAEAGELAIKVVRKYHSNKGNPERYRIIGCEGAFHGRTLATLAAAGNEKYLKGFGPPVAGFDHVPFGDLDAMRAAITNETAGIIVEPIQGEGGVRAGSPEYLRGLREIADTFGLMLIFDEVQCGMGRSGKLWAHQYAGITPDVMMVAKGIGGGFPLGAVLATEAAAAPMARPMAAIRWRPRSATLSWTSCSPPASSITWQRALPSCLRACKGWCIAIRRSWPRRGARDCCSGCGASSPIPTWCGP